MELEVLLHGINVVKDIIDNPWDDALHGWVVNDPLHGMGLSGRRLSVSKYGSIVSTKNICEKSMSKKFNTFTLLQFLDIPLTMFFAVASYT